MTVESIKSEPVLDIEGTLARFGGDRNLFAEMSGILLEDSPRVVAELRRAIAANDAKAIRAHAHSLRGLFAGCGGVRAANVAQKLEDVGQSSDRCQAGSLLEALETEFEQLMRALRQFRA
jgi:two-component system, sensor histidine kinase and response regulator